MQRRFNKTLLPCTLLVFLGCVCHLLYSKPLTCEHLTLSLDILININKQYLYSDSEILIHNYVFLVQHTFIHRFPTFMENIEVEEKPGKVMEFDLVMEK